MTFGTCVEESLAPNDLRMNLQGPGIAPLVALSRWWSSANVVRRRLAVL